MEDYATAGIIVEQEKVPAMPVSEASAILRKKKQGKSPESSMKIQDGETTACVQIAASVRRPGRVLQALQNC